MNAVAETAVNPFGSSAVAARQSDALVAVEQSRAIAETQAAMLVAKKFPRDPVMAMDRILNACTRPGLADAAIYTYARGGTDITGPSIRLAEAMAQAWGNIKTSVRELEQRDGVSTMQTIAWDLETGYQVDKVFQVRHWRDTKAGGYALKDSRDIYELSANQASRRLRACILAVIPGDVTEAAVKQCEVTLNTKAEVTPDRLKALVEKFAAFNVTQGQIEKRIQRHLDSMTPAQMVALGKVYNSLKDGMSAPGDWFEADESAGQDAGAPARGTAGVKAAILKAKPKAAPAAAPYEGPDEIATLRAIDAAGDAEVAALVLDGVRGAPFYEKAQAAFTARWVKAED